jgi:ABC-2 type transport system ATP-binding protein
MSENYIQLKDVCKRFDKNLVLDKINLSIPEKKITGIIGASGEGKSTILKLLIGFYKPTSGEILLGGKNMFKELRVSKRRIGFSTEDGSFYENLSVKENVFHFGRLHQLRRKEIKERFMKILELVGLAGAVNTLGRDLSAGMKKRLDIACSLIHDPNVLIMDEPTADLDPLLRLQILTLIKEINGIGTTVIVTTQILEEMDQICDKVAILFNKNMTDQGTPDEIKRKYNVGSLNQVFNGLFSGGRCLDERRGCSIVGYKEVGES